MELDNFIIGIRGVRRWEFAKKKQLLVAKKIEQLLSNIDLVEVVDKRLEVVEVVDRSRSNRSSWQKIEVVDSSSREVVDRSRSSWQKTKVVDSSSREVVEVVDRSRSSWQKIEVEVVDSISNEVVEVVERR